MRVRLGMSNSRFGEGSVLRVDSRIEEISIRMSKDKVCHLLSKEPFVFTSSETPVSESLEYNRALFEIVFRGEVWIRRMFSATSNLFQRVLFVEKSVSVSLIVLFLVYLVTLSN